MIKRFLPLLFILDSSLHSDLFDCLKSIKEKSNFHSLQNIDFIYMINLDKRPEKFLQSSSLLNQYGIYPYRFSAINGWTLPLETINEVGLKYEFNMTSLFSTFYPIEAEGDPSNGFMTKENQAYFGHGISLGAIGCTLSHLSVLKDALDSGYETIWIMEDDAEPIRNPLIIPKLIDKLDSLVGKANWDVLFTDVDYRTSAEHYLIAYGAQKRPDMDSSFEERYSEKYTINKKISEDFRKISARFGTHSMIIRRSGIEKLLQYFLHHKIFLPYDLENYLVPGINRYSFCYDVVTNSLNALTDNAKSE